MKKFLLVVLVVFTLAYGIDKSGVPNSFTASTVAQSSKVNANFDSLKSAHNILIDTFLVYRADSSKTLCSLEAVSGSGLILIDTSGKGIYIKSGGNVGVNTFSPTFKLHVVGGVRGDSVIVPTYLNVSAGEVYAGSAKCGLIAAGAVMALNGNLAVTTVIPTGAYYSPGIAYGGTNYEGVTDSVKFTSDTLVFDGGILIKHLP